MIKTIDDKMKFVDKVLLSTNNISHRYYKEILKYINELKRENNHLYNANITLMNKIKELEHEDNRNTYEDSE